MDSNAYSIHSYGPQRTKCNANITWAAALLCFFPPPAPGLVAQHLHVVYTTRTHPSSPQKCPPEFLVTRPGLRIQQKKQPPKSERMKN